MRQGTLRIGPVIWFVCKKESACTKARVPVLKIKQCLFPRFGNFTPHDDNFIRIVAVHCNFCVTLDIEVQ